jgi:anti-sigma factor RsiW
MNDRPATREELLGALVDGELDAEESARVASLVAGDPALSEMYTKFRADKAALGRLYGPLLERPVPADWIAKIDRQARVRRPVQLAWWASAAAVLVVAIVSALYFRPLPFSDEEGIVREAIAARAHDLSPREEIVAGNPAQIRAIDRAMTESIKMNLRAPNLSRMGYRLARAAIYDRTPGGRAVELVYRGSASRNLTIYVRRPTSAVRFDQFKRDGLRICVWQDEVLGTVIAGRISAAEMQRIASLVYTGLET